MHLFLAGIHTFASGCVVDRGGIKQGKVFWASEDRDWATQMEHSCHQLLHGVPVQTFWMWKRAIAAGLSSIAMELV